MAEIEITLPTVQYGNVKIRGTAEEWGLDTIADAPDVGVWAATYLNLFQQGFKVGAAMDVDAHLGTTGAPVSASEGEVGAQAQEWLDEGLGGVTELPKNEYKVGDTVTVGGIEFTKHSDAPWTAPAVDAKPKPWEAEETQAPKPAVVVSAGW